MATASESKHLKLEVSNFGPIAEGAVELRPMTVFVGPSNTGKSYLATLIYALHQFFGDFAIGTSGGSNTPSTMFSRGRSAMAWMQNVELSEDDVQVIYDWANSDWYQNLIFFSQPGFIKYETDLPDDISGVVRRAISNLRHLSKDLDSEIVRCFGTSGVENLVGYPGNGSSTFSLNGTTSDVSGISGNFRYSIAMTKQGANINAVIPETMPVSLRQNSLLNRTLPSLEDSPGGRETAARWILGALSRDALASSVGNIGCPAYYLPADRAGVMHAHQVAVRGLIASASRVGLRRDAPMPVLSGVLGDFLEHLVALASARPLYEQTNFNDLAIDMEQRLIKGTVLVERSQIDYPSFVYRPDGWQHDLPLMNTSSMVSELAPVVLYLRYVVQPGDTLIVEEPETNLHPQAQVEFTRVLAAAVKAGIRIIITTHSEWVLEELANLVRMSELSPERREGLEAAEFALTPDEVGAWFFDPGGEDGGSVIREIPLDVDSGTFPSGFGLVTADLYNRWVEITSRVENG